MGRSFYSPDLGRRQPLGEGLESWRGFYQSIRPTQMGLSLNIGMTIFFLFHFTCFLLLVPCLAASVLIMHFNFWHVLELLCFMQHGPSSKIAVQCSDVCFIICSRASELGSFTQVS